jgi:hypothetical protein
MCARFFVSILRILYAGILCLALRHYLSVRVRYSCSITTFHCMICSYATGLVRFPSAVICPDHRLANFIDCGVTFQKVSTGVHTSLAAGHQSVNKFRMVVPFVVSVFWRLEV